MDVLMRNHVNVLDGGPRPLMFGHGFGCDQRMWRRVAPRFAPAHRVVLFDYVGSGASDKAAYDSRRYRTLDGYAEDVVEVGEALGLRGAVFVGHSVSGMIGLKAALRAPGLFERVVLVAPSPRYLNDPATGYEGGFERDDVDGLLALMDQNWLGWASALSGMAVKEADLAEELRQSFCSTDPRTMREFAVATFLSDERATLPRVETPCLVVQCAHDDIAPVAVGEYLRDHLRGSTYRMLDATGHCPQMSHPDEVSALLATYLAEPARV